MRRAFKYRLYPNVNQLREMEIALETCRRIYNSSLEKRIAAYQEDETTLSRYDLSKQFTEAKKDNPWYQRINRSAVTAVLIKLERAYQAFFRRVKAGEKPGFPRFKGRDRFDSIEYQNGWGLDGDRLRIQFVGDVKVELHRPVEGTIKTVTLKREADKWYAVFSCDLGDVAIQPSINPPIGIDLGLSSFLTTTEGEHVPNPRYLKDALPELRRVQRKIALKDGKKHKSREYMKRGSKNRAKVKRKLRKLHTKVANQRRDHHHKVASKLVRSHGLIAMECLDIKGMLEDSGIQGESGNRRFSRSISDAAWGGFASILSSKAESAGVTVVKVDPRGTTQGCSGCGAVVPKTIRDRWHECPYCGLSLDRDENAARNILRRALPGWTGPAGVNPGVGLDRPRSVARSPSHAHEGVEDLSVSPSAKPRRSRKPNPDKVVASKNGVERFLNDASTKSSKELRNGEGRQENPPNVPRVRSLNRSVQKTFWEGT
jgi:putative transposase